MAAYVSWKNSTAASKVKELEHLKSKQEVPVQEEPISQAMKIDPEPVKATAGE